MLHILTGYADAGYLFDPHMAKSQTGYVFTYAGIAISWKSTNQTLAATSSNHAELIALYEANRECVWLRSMIGKLQEDCGLNDTTRAPTIIYENNDACVNQVREGYIKETKQNTCHPNYSLHMICRKMSKKFNLVKTPLIYSQSHFRQSNSSI